jgi:hypothetical protein
VVSLMVNTSSLRMRDDSFALMLLAGDELSFSIRNWSLYDARKKLGLH